MYGIAMRREIRNMGGRGGDGQHPQRFPLVFPSDSPAAPAADVVRAMADSVRGGGSTEAVGERPATAHTGVETACLSGVCCWHRAVRVTIRIPRWIRAVTGSHSTGSLGTDNPRFISSFFLHTPLHTPRLRRPPSAALRLVRWRVDGRRRARVRVRVRCCDAPGRSARIADLRRLDSARTSAVDCALLE